MLYLFYGDNDFAARRNIREIVEAKRKDAVVHRINSENATEEALANLFASERDLFGTKRIVILEELLKTDFSKMIFDCRDTLAESKNLYLCFERSLDRAIVKKLEKHARIQKFELPEGDMLRRWIAKEAVARGIRLSSAEVEAFAALGGDLWALDGALEIKLLGGDIANAEVSANPFEFSDALMVRDTHRAYILFHHDLASGISTEELFWKAWWAARTLATIAPFQGSGLAAATIKEKTGLHPFVIQKTLRAAARWRAGENEALLDRLFSAWRDARLEAGDLTPHLERILLSRV